MIDTNALKKVKVLIVEDDPDIIEVISTIFNYSGISFFAADNGKDAISKAKKEKPHIILMDLALPIMDGWEATRQIKSHKDTKDIPVIAITAHFEEKERASAMAAGCDGFITKPFTPYFIIEKIKEVLKKKSPLFNKKLKRQSTR